MRLRRSYRRHKRLQFLIAYLLRLGWIVKLHPNGYLRFKRPGRHAVYVSSLRHKSRRRKS